MKRLLTLALLALKRGSFKRLALSATLVCAHALAQNAALMPMPRLTFLDSNGVPLAGGYLYTCVAGTSCTPALPGRPAVNPLATYTDSSAGVANANPIILDAAGRANVWLGKNMYKIVVQDQFGVTQYSQDNVNAAAFAVTGSLAGANGAGLVTYTASGTGAVSRTVAAKLGDSVSVKDYGATGNGTTDDTAAINAALAAAHSVYFPDGNYLLNCEMPTDLHFGSGGIVPQSNTAITFAGNAKLTCKASTTGFYVAIRLPNGISNVQINGGTLDGQRSLVVAPGTETGFGIGCNGCSNLTVRDTVAQNFWGDGFYITNKGASIPTGIILDHVTANNSRRNGLSVEAVNGLKVSNSIFEYSNGTAPQMGVDIEPSGGTGGTTNIELLNNTYLNNTWSGVSLAGGTGTDISNTKIRGGIVSGNGTTTEGQVYVYNVNLPVEVSGLTVTGGTGSGIYVTTATDITIKDNIVVGNNTTTHAGSSGIQVGNATRTTITGNVIRPGSGHQFYGIALAGTTNSYLTENDLMNSGTTGDYNDFSGTGNLIFSNRLTSGYVLAGALGAPTYTPGTPSLSLGNVAATAGRTYPIALAAQTTDGSFSIGTGDATAEAYLELRGGQYSSNNAGATSISGIRFMRGTSATTFQTLLTLNNTATFTTPVTFSGSSSTVTISGPAAINNTISLGSYHSLTGTRFLCVATDGTVSASATACSGT